MHEFHLEGKAVAALYPVPTNLKLTCIMAA